MKKIILWGIWIILPLLLSCKLEKIDDSQINEAVITFDTTIVTSPFGDAGVGVAQLKDGTYLIGAYGGKQIIHLSKDGGVLDSYGDINAFWIHDFYYKPVQDEVIVCGFMGPTDLHGYVGSFKNGANLDKEVIVSNGGVTWFHSIVQSNTGDYTFVGQNASNFFLGYLDSQLSTDPNTFSDFFIPYNLIHGNLIQTKSGNYVYCASSFSVNGNFVVKTKPNTLFNNQIEWTYDFGDFLPIRILESGTNYLFAGIKSSKPYFIVMSPSKIVLYEDQIGGGGDGSLYDIKPVADGGFILAGSISGAGTNGGADLYLVKLKQDYSVQWEKHFGGPLDEYGQRVSTTSDGGFIAVGSSKSFGNGENDIYVVKTDKDGLIK